MIHQRLAGGLGNQIFQLAAGLNLSRKFNCPLVLYSHALGSYNAVRTLDLNKIFDLDDICVISTRPLPWPLRYRVPRLLSPHSIGSRFISDKNYSRVCAGDSCPGESYIDGYFVESLTQNVFDKSVEYLLGQLRRDGDVHETWNQCCIHVRGGDFLTLGWELPEIEDYYNQSIRAVLKLNPNLRFTVITDDLEFAKKIAFKFPVSVAFESMGLKGDFFCLTDSEYAILSNSTFAFWAGAFRSNKTGAKTTWLPGEWRPGAPRNIRVISE